MKHDFLNDPRFAGIKPFVKKVWLSSPTMHGEEQKWVDDAIVTNWVSTVGANINEVSASLRKRLGASMRWLCPPVRQRCIWPSSCAARSCTASRRWGMARWKATRCSAPRYDL